MKSRTSSCISAPSARNSLKVVPAPFGTWRSDKGAGGGGFGADCAFGEGDASALCATGAVSGCFLFKLKTLKPGEYYAVKASAFGEGVSSGISWRNAEGKYVGRALKMPFVGDDGRWRHGFAVVCVPTDAASMTVTLDVNVAKGEKAWFDNVGVFRLCEAPGPEPEPETRKPVR